MKKQDGKQRLFEVMQRLDKTFKTKINEEYTLSALRMPDATEVTFAINASSDEEALAVAKEKFADEVSKGMNLGNSYLLKGDVNIGKVNENFEEESEEFIPHGTYTVSNTGGYEIMLSPDGEQAKVRDAFGSDNPETSDWLEIEYIPDEETGESEPVIDPNGYNIPLNQVMRINESPMFGGEKVSQEMYDELQYDKGEMEKAMGDAFKTPPDYQMRNQVKAGQTVELSDGDKVLIKKIDTPRGLIDVRVYPTDENGKKYYPKGFFDITWSLKQFDAIVGDNTSLNMTEVEKEIDEYFKKPYSTYGKSGDPRIITLKYDTVCTETGKPLKAGEKAIYYPRTKDFFCLDSKQADEFRGWKQDMDMGYDY